MRSVIVRGLYRGLGCDPRALQAKTDLSTIRGGQVRSICVPQ